MYKIAYLESFHRLSRQSGDNNILINHHMIGRLQGVMEVAKQKGQLDLNWINTEGDLGKFLDLKQYESYDAE